MVERLIGLPFILIASPILTIVVMTLWYHFRANSEAARTLSAISIFLMTPFVAAVTIPWRWGEIDDGPAAGLPLFAALYETFWIWCASLVLLFLLDGLFTRFFRDLRNKIEIDPETFE